MVLTLPAASPSVQCLWCSADCPPSCSLTPAHYAPGQAVNSLWAHQAVSCFYPFSKTFLCLKYTLLLNQHQKLLLILQKPPTLNRPLFCPEKADHLCWTCHCTLSSLVILCGSHVFCTSVAPFELSVAREQFLISFFNVSPCLAHQRYV